MSVSFPPDAGPEPQNPRIRQTDRQAGGRAGHEASRRAFRSPEARNRRGQQLHLIPHAHIQPAICNHEGHPFSHILCARECATENRT